jgi:hypothetical protein
MPPDHDHFSGRVILVGLQRMPDRETGTQTAGLTAGPGNELNFALAPYYPAEQARGTR